MDKEIKKVFPVFEKQTFPSKEERDYEKNYSVYCSLCSTTLSYASYFSHKSSKYHMNNEKKTAILPNYEEVVNKTQTINKETKNEVVDKSLDDTKAMIIHYMRQINGFYDKENKKIKKNEGKITHCNICNLDISKTNILKHNKSKKHIAKKEITVI